MRYFAYGSNMSPERIRARAPSAVFVSRAYLEGHVLTFHKPGLDGSGKCDACPSANSQDRVWGALYEVSAEDMKALDIYEGRGFAYLRKSVVVHTDAGQSETAKVYVAIEQDDGQVPYDWYLEHVLRGARVIGLPETYIDLLKTTESKRDRNFAREMKERSIYSDDLE